MKIVIDIAEEKYNILKSDLYNTFPAKMKRWGLEAIRKGVPLPRGHWRLDPDSWFDMFPAFNGYRCSECNSLSVFDDSYCPHCGAKMESEEEE